MTLMTLNNKTKPEDEAVQTIITHYHYKKNSLFHSFVFIGFMIAIFIQLYLTRCLDGLGGVTKH